MMQLNPIEFFFPVHQKHGNQHALTLALLPTKHLYAVFHSRHFTIPRSHHALIAAVDAEKQTNKQFHA